MASARYKTRYTVSMEPGFLWLVAYFLPCAGVLIFLHALPSYRPGKFIGAATGGIGLVLSVIISQLVIRADGLVFPWFGAPTSVLLYILSAVVALFALGRFGGVYAAGVFLQEACMLSIAFFLFSFSYPFYATALLLVPLFALSHLLQIEHGFIKVVATSLWGAISLFLFLKTQDIFLIAALHTLLGVIFIRKALMYPTTDFVIRRAPK